MLDNNLGGRLGSALSTGRAFLNNQNPQLRLKSAKVSIIAQLERRKPPMILLQNQFKQVHDLWLKGQQLGRNLVTERRLVEFPQMDKNVEADLKKSEVFIGKIKHTSEKPLFPVL